MGTAFVREQDVMKRTRGTPLGPDLSQRATYGSRSEPGGPQQPRFSGDAEQGGGDLDYPKRNLASAFNGQSTYSGYARADFTQSTINLVTCVLGAGALGYPFCFKECGLALATIIMFITLIATRISYQLMLYCAQLSTRKTYEGIAEAALGRRGRIVVEICIAAMNLGALVAFLDILSDVLSAVAGTIIPPGAEPSRPAYLTGVTVLGALPVSLVVRDHALIAALSNASVAFVVIFAMVVFCCAFTPIATAALGLHKTMAAVGSTATAAAGVTAAAAAAGAGGSASAGTAATAAAFSMPALHMWHVQGVLVALPVMAYGFTAHQYYMGIYTMLKAPSVRKMKSITDLALLICAGVYWTMGVGGYASFGERTAGDIIRNLGGQQSMGVIGAYARALKLCYGMAILGNIPLVIMPFYSLLRPLIPEDAQIKQGTASLAGACTLAGAKHVAAAVLKGSGSRGIPAHFGNGPVRIPSASGPKLKTSCGGEDDPALTGDGDGFAGPAPLLPPSWPQQTLNSSCNNSCSKPQDVNRQQQQHLDPHLATEQASYMLTATQHCLVVFIVLGLGLASAIWLPNVELIFGLTGSTASVLVAFIIPALCFINLYEAAPELGSSSSSSTSPHGGGLVGAFRYGCCCCCQGVASLFSSSSSSGYYPNAAYSSPSKVPVLVVPELRAQWLCRYRLAVALLVFGIISGLLCTDAILSSISEEKAVVQLAQELVAHEAVVAETNRAQQKAKEAAAAVDAVSTAVEQLGTVTTSTSQTLGALTAAAAALNTISNGSSHASNGSSKHSVWDLKGRLEERKQKIADDGVLRNTEAALSAATADITSTMEAVTQVVTKLDKSITKIKADAVAAAAGIAQQQQPVAAAAAAQSPAAGSTAAAAAAAAAPDGTILSQTPAAGSSHIIPHHGEVVDAGDSSQAAATSSPAVPAAGDTAAAAAGGAAGTPLTNAAVSRSEAYDRAAEMAAELGKALGVFSQSAGSSISSITAGKSLEQVRDSALSALTALNMTADVLHQVQEAVAAARHSQRKGSSSSGAGSGSESKLVREMAVEAMQRALNATAASALAVKITEDALSAAANEETSELLTALTRVAQDLEKSAAAAGGKLTVTPHQPTSITVTSELAQPAAAAAATGSDNATITSITGSESGAQAQQPQQAQPTVTDAAAAAAKANAAAHADSASHAAAGEDSTAEGAVVSGPDSDSVASGAADTRASRAEGKAAQQPSQQAGAVTGNHAASTPATSEATAADTAQQQAGTATALAAGSTADKGATASQELVGSNPDTLVAVAGEAAHRPQHEPIVNSSSSNSSSATGSDAHQHAAHQSAGVHHTAASLSATEAAKVRGVILKLATVLSSSSNGTGEPAAANITALAAAIQDAVAWTHDSKSAVLELISEDLGKTQPKVAQRVVGIVQDISVTGAALKQEQQQQQRAAAAVEARAGLLQEQQQHKAADAEVAGPVVIVTADGILQQLSAAGTAATGGPVVGVPGTENQSQATAAATVSGEKDAAVASGDQADRTAAAAARTTADPAAGPVVKLPAAGTHDAAAAVGVTVTVQPTQTQDPVENGAESAATQGVVAPRQQLRQ